MEGAGNHSGFSERPLDQLTFEGDEHRVFHIMVCEFWKGWQLEMTWTASYTNKNTAKLFNWLTSRCCSYGGMLPRVCCCCSNLGNTEPRMQEQGVSMTCLGETGKGKESCATFYLEEKWGTGPRVLSWYFLVWVTREKHFQNLHGVFLDLASWSSFIKGECNYLTHKASWTWLWLRTLQMNYSLSHEQFWNRLNDLKQHPWNMFQHKQPMDDVSTRIITND